MKPKLNYLFAGIAITAIVFSTVAFKSKSRPNGSPMEFLQLTAIESVVPGGLGRSRLIAVDAEGKEDEIKLENFFSLVGINFGNIRSNDEVITEKIAELSSQGWELKFTNTGVDGADKSTGIFITRYIFERPKQQ